ncbi:MAG: hypothetical protein IT373_19080 [Polyangiaceae bacterium]|nr:hypothetical protein [Polyangiaceae bacterium]
MRVRTFLILAVAVWVPALAVAQPGCSSVVEITDTRDGGNGEGGFLFIDAPADAPPDGPAPADAPSDYVDPGCPDAGPPIQDFQCDAYHQGNGDCAPGEACYIYVQYPDPSEPCGQEIYGSFCYPAGSGTQGSPCGGGQDCAAGYVCVITGSGTQCVQLCPLVGNDNCPPGYVCEVIDVEGFGGCL